MKQQPSWADRTWAVVYILVFIVGWNGALDSGTVEEPKYGGMLLALLFVTAMVYCWGRSIKITMARWPSGGGRAIGVALFVLAGWILGPVLMLALPSRGRS